MQISKTQISATEWHLEIKDPAGFVVFDGPLFLGTRTVDIEIDDLVARLTNPQPWTPTEAELLPGAKANKIAELGAACRAQIEGGFDSDALGFPHHYPAQPQDQANLTASVTASLVPNLPAGWTTAFWCADSSGVWAYAEHTASQIQQVGLDGKAAITAALQRNATLRAQVEAAATLADVEAVLW